MGEKFAKNYVIKKVSEHIKNSSGDQEIKECLEQMLNEYKRLKEPKFQSQKSWFYGLAIGVAVTIAVLLCTILSREDMKGNATLIITLISIGVVLFAFIFYFVYKYNLNYIDALSEDYMKDKELWRKIERENTETEQSIDISGNMKEDELNKFIVRLKNNGIVCSDEFQKFKASINKSITNKVENLELDTLLKKIDLVLEARKMPTTDEDLYKQIMDTSNKWNNYLKKNNENEENELSKKLQELINLAKSKKEKKS